MSAQEAAGTVAQAALATATDSALLERIGTGDERALAELYARYAAIVFSFVSARAPNRTVAEEVSADVWLGCWRSAAAFRHDSRVLTWLLGIAKRQIHSHTRRRQLPQVPLDESDHDQQAVESDPAELTVSADQTEALLQALRSLPADLTEVVRLAWVHELPYEEIAQLVGIPRGTVKSRVSRARRLLREKLKEER